jgi:hypothetical protein
VRARPVLSLRAVASTFDVRFVAPSAGMREVLSSWLPTRGIRSRARRKTRRATRVAARNESSDASPAEAAETAAAAAPAVGRPRHGERSRRRPVLSSAPAPQEPADSELGSGVMRDSTPEHGSATEFESTNGHGSGDEVETELELETDAELTAHEASTNGSSLSASEPCLRPGTSRREQFADKARAVPATPANVPQAEETVQHLVGPAGATRLPRVESQSDFRKRMFWDGHRDKLLRSADGCLFRVYPMVMNGDCGFAAIAKGVNLHAMEEAPAEDDEKRRERPSSRSGMSHATIAFLNSYRRPKEASSQDIRRLMAEEVSANRPIYSAISSGLFTEPQLTTFVKSVVRPGMAGHWLGAEIGGLEFVAVARALDITLALYCFDVPSQTVRRFEEAKSENSKYEICLFFAGPAASGHFDLLWKMAPPLQEVAA